jgi:hypothetical protein
MENTRWQIAASYRKSPKCTYSQIIGRKDPCIEMDARIVGCIRPMHAEMLIP